MPVVAMECAANVVNNPVSKKTVGRTCMTGSPDQLNSCSERYSSR